ncbi:hypothetical protein V1477_019048 [Vespula maculifrons]|uniref:Uncharacterized protein n=1 Tax=Vespula maculifrons TaxID=7453 RepID=A0ABD2ATU9_VESMC
MSPIVYYDCCQVVPMYDLIKVDHYLRSIVGINITSRHNVFSEACVKEEYAIVSFKNTLYSSVLLNFQFMILRIEKL